MKLFGTGVGSQSIKVRLVGRRASEGMSDAGRAIEETAGPVRPASEIISELGSSEISTHWSVLIVGCCRGNIRRRPSKRRFALKGSTVQDRLIGVEGKLC